MKYVNCLFFLGHCLLFNCMVTSQTLCPHPDVPVDGNYSSTDIIFEPGEEVRYSCRKRFALDGKDKRTCNINGTWSDHAPFCDPIAKLRNPSVTNKKAVSYLVNRISDGNTSSCFDWINARGEYMYINIEKKIIVRTIRLFLKPGRIIIQILAGLNNNVRVCNDYSSTIATNQWITIKCRENLAADLVKIVVIEAITSSICEVEVYGKGEDGCDQPPVEMVPNGHFEVSRSKAMLICQKGYRSENDRLVCEGKSTWKGGQLQCNEVLCDATLLPEIPNSRWNFDGLTKQVSVGTKSNFTCIDGYRKTDESDTATCQQDGTWTKTKATCVEILCDATLLSKHPGGGKWDLIGKTKKISPGTKCKLTCIDGYRKTKGFDIAICQWNGSWMKPKATCVEEIKDFTPNSTNSMNIRSIIFIAVGIVILVLILSLLTIIICFVKKQRDKDVIVVYQSQRSVSVPISEMEYATPLYEPLQPIAPPIPTSPRPNAQLQSAKPAAMNMQTSYFKNIPERSTENSTFDTMKQSSIYSS